MNKNELKKNSAAFPLHNLLKCMSIGTMPTKVALFFGKWGTSLGPGDLH
jgi:hypothetical protein